MYAKMRFGHFCKVWRRKKILFPYFKGLCWTIYSYLTNKKMLKLCRFWGTWVAQSVKHLTLDFSPGHDLRVCEFKPHLSAEPAWDSLSPSLFAPALLSLSIYIY